MPMQSPTPFERFWFDLNNVRRRGAWNAGAQYLADDLVRVSGVWYVSMSDHTAGDVFSVDLAARKWHRYTAVIGGLRFYVHTASPATTTAGDVVFADGTLWNPGSGEGLYLRNAANDDWHFLG